MWGLWWVGKRGRRFARSRVECMEQEWGRCWRPVFYSGFGTRILLWGHIFLLCKVKSVWLNWIPLGTTADSPQLRCAHTQLASALRAFQVDASLTQLPPWDRGRKPGPGDFDPLCLHLQDPGHCRNPLQHTRGPEDPAGRACPEAPEARVRDTQWAPSFFFLLYQ